MIKLKIAGPRWTVTLDRPDKANALSLAMLQRLLEIFNAAQNAPDLRVLVIGGAGERVFCAGADLIEAKAANSLTTHPIWAEVTETLAGLPCLTITALNGAIAGGGFALALGCDLRISVPDARFFYPVLARGFLPQKDHVKRMTSLIGPAHTKLILLGGQKIQADEALRIGLIDKVVERSRMDEEIARLSMAALGSSARILAGIKRLCNGTSP